MQPVDRLAWTARTRSLLKPRLSVAVKELAVSLALLLTGFNSLPIFPGRFTFFLLEFLSLHYYLSGWMSIKLPEFEYCISNLFVSVEARLNVRHVCTLNTNLLTKYYIKLN